MPDSERRRGPATFRQRDVTAALKSARDAGLEVLRYEIDKAGTIVVVISSKATEIERDEEVAAWERAYP